VSQNINVIQLQPGQKTNGKSMQLRGLILNKSLLLSQLFVGAVFCSKQ